MKKLIYVIHEHHATHLHFDLRLQMGGVLKSWAVPKKPNNIDKRLAVQVTDHPLSYAKFKGIIPEGYGKGLVKIWDSGNYDLIEKGKDKFLIKLHGKKLKGNWALIRLKNNPKNWLFFKTKS